jgi:L-alanine-DL-glutamate epimerase-like enolase superfamily enzyme
VNTRHIARIDVLSLDLKFNKPFKIALGEIQSSENVLVRIFDDEGRYGIGEASPLWTIAGETRPIAIEAARVLASLVIGKDPGAIGARLAEMDAFLVHNTTIKSAFDGALYDLAAKHAGLPLYAFLGGENREIISDMTLGIDTPQKMADGAAAYKTTGALAIKVKLGTDTESDVKRITAIRERIGKEMILRIDANQGWDVVTAIRTLRALEPYGIQYCEEPVAHWNNEGLRRVRMASPIPVMADESLFDHHDAFRLASMGAADYFNIKLAKSGGIHTALKINAVAEAAGIPCMLGGMFETRIGISTGTHLIAACPNIVFADLDSINHYSEDPVTGGVVFNGSRVTIPETPGHGADIKPEYAKLEFSVKK